MQVRVESVRRRRCARASWALILASVSPEAGAAQQSRGGIGLDPVPAAAIELGPGVWRERLERNARHTLPALWAELEARGLFANFALAAGTAEGEHSGDPRHDALVYELIEGAARGLRYAPDPALRARIDALVATIAAAQKKDGYLNTFVQLGVGTRPWRDLAEGRELFCAARLIEAGLALAEATGERALLEVAIRMADRIERSFGPDGTLRDPPGHPGIEAALVELARATGEERYAELASSFLDARGSPEREKLYGEHAIDDHPIVKTRIAYGEVERAVELQRGVAEVARLLAYAENYDLALTISDDTFRKKTCITGGLGVLDEHGERVFGEAWALPDATVACETCSSAASASWQRSMFLLTGHAVYPTLAEEVLYNALAAGVSQDGLAFRRDNPLSSDAGAARAAWPEPGCCAVAAFRAIADAPGGFVARKGLDLFIAGYAPCALTLPMGETSVRLTIETDYPRDGKVAIRYESNWSRAFSIHVLIPAWCRDNVPIGVNEVNREAIVSHGEDPGTWLAFQREWTKGDVLMLELPLDPVRVHAAPEAAAQRGRACLKRGPEVYAFEALDHSVGLESVWLPPEAELACEWRPELLGGVHVIRATGLALQRAGEEIVHAPVQLTAIPYALTQNRGACAFRVWIPESPALCKLP